MPPGNPEGGHFLTLKFLWMKKKTSKKKAVPKTISVKNTNGTKSRFARKGGGTTKAGAASTVTATQNA